jgi:hypothetical protein
MILSSNWTYFSLKHLAHACKRDLMSRCVHAALRLRVFAGLCYSPSCCCAQLSTTTLKAYDGLEVCLCAFLFWVLGGGEYLASRLDSFTPSERLPALFTGKAALNPDHVWLLWRRESLLPWLVNGTRSRGQYTDWCDIALCNRRVHRRKTIFCLEWVQSSLSWSQMNRMSLAVCGEDPPVTTSIGWKPVVETVKLCAVVGETMTSCLLKVYKLHFL